MTDTQTPIVALTDDSTTYYLLPAAPFGDTWRRTVTWTTAGGDTLTPVNSNPNRPHGGWHQASGGVQDLTASQPGPSVKTGYRLRDPEVESPKFPVELPPDGLAALDLDDDTATVLYASVFVDGPTVNRTFAAADMIVADEAAAPAPDDGLRWVPNLRDELKRHRALHHLFPGHLEGFRQAVVDAAGALSLIRGGVLSGARVDRERPTIVRVSTEVPYEPHTTRFVWDTGRNGQKLKRGRTVVETKRLEVSVQVPDVIAGRNRADAKTRWDAEMASILDTITEALTPAPCWHCQGTGVVARKDASTPAASRG